jgi:hypothetical protein
VRGDRAELGNRGKSVTLQAPPPVRKISVWPSLVSCAFPFCSVRCPLRAGGMRHQIRSGRPTGRGKQFVSRSPRIVATHRVFRGAEITFRKTNPGVRSRVLWQRCIISQNERALGRGACGRKVAIRKTSSSAGAVAAMQRFAKRRSWRGPAVRHTGRLRPHSQVVRHWRSKVESGKTNSRPGRFAWRIRARRAPMLTHGGTATRRAPKSPLTAFRTRGRRRRRGRARCRRGHRDGRRPPPSRSEHRGARRAPARRPPVPPAGTPGEPRLRPAP